MFGGSTAVGEPHTERLIEYLCGSNFVSTKCKKVGNEKSSNAHYRRCYSGNNGSLTILLIHPFTTTGEIILDPRSKLPYRFEVKFDVPSSN